MDTQDESDIEVYREQFGTRIIVRCEDLKLRLQANLADEGQEERLSNVSGKLNIDFVGFLGMDKFENLPWIMNCL